MSTQEAFQALKVDGDTKFKARNWSGACDAYDHYYSQKYPNQETMSNEDSVLLVKYAEALIELYTEKKNQGGQPDEEDLQTAATYLLTARAAMDSMDTSAYPVYSLIDTYGLLANIGLKNHQYERAAEENLAGYSIACQRTDCSWRDRLSLLFSAGIATECAGKLSEAIELINKCIAYVDEEKAKEHSQDDMSLLDDFRQDFEDKLTQLNQDLASIHPTNN